MFAEAETETTVILPADFASAVDRHGALKARASVNAAPFRRPGEAKAAQVQPVRAEAEPVDGDEEEEEEEDDEDEDERWYKEQGAKDANWGKHVRLIPDPISSPWPHKRAALTELNDLPHTYKGARNVTMIAALALNADPTKGPFNSDFRLGAFQLKLLLVESPFEAEARK